MLTILPPDRYGRFGFLIGDARNPERNSCATKKAVVEVAKTLGLDPGWLAECLNAALADDPPGGVFEESRPPTPYVDVPVRVRGRRRGADAATVYASIDAALRAPELPPEPLIEWDTDEFLAAVDLDGPDKSELTTVEALDAAINRIDPQPCYYWRTHHGGVRLIYKATSPVSAGDIAAVAYLSARSVWPSARVEIKTDTRHPGGERDGLRCGPVRIGPEFPLLDGIQSQLTNEVVADDAIDQWLEDRGMIRGGRYDHTKCVIAPSESGEREPVQVNSQGVYCHKCAGTTGRGFRKFTGLCGTRSASLLGLMVRNRVHWGHAKHCVREILGFTDHVAKRVYRAALQLGSGADPDTVAAVFSPTLHYIRLDGFWASGAGEPYDKRIGPMLATLPVCEGSAAVVAELGQTVSLDTRGYFALAPVWGFALTGVWQAAMNEHRLPTVTMFPGELQPAHMEDCRPKYVRRIERMDVAEAWQLLETVFPRMNRRYVTLLIAAKGCAEAEVGLPPMIWVSGPTSAAKTASVQVAAAICGDSVKEPVWHADPDKTRRGIFDAKTTGSYCVFNEVLKEGGDAKRKPLSTMNFLLNVTPRSTSHLLYVGAVKLGRLPVLVFTDTELPQDVAEDAQLARRLTAVRLTERVDWVETLRDTGVNMPDKLRTSVEGRFVEACNTILSDIVDTYFRASMTFSEIAESLGFPSILDDQQAGTLASLREFFDLLCGGPDAEAKDVRSLGDGDGWKVVDPIHETPLALAWRDLADVDNPYASRRCSSQDWSRVLQVKQGVRFDSKRVGRRTLMRVRGDDGKCNRDLLAAVELEPGQVRSDRLGKSIDGRHFDGFKSLS